jgi:hypothetical protein
MDRQVSQLLLQVDANVAVAQRELQNLARIVRQSSGDMNSSLDTTVRAHARLGSAMGNTRIAQMELQHVITASSDAYAAGASPIRILSLEMGRLAEAAAFLGGSGGGGVMGKLGAFMAGPWGIAVLIGVQVLSRLIGKHAEASNSVADLVDKMRKEATQAANNKIAEGEWANSIDGLIDRNQKLIDKLKERLKAEEDLDAQALQQAQRDKATADAALDAAKKRLDALQAQYDASAGQPSGVGIGQGAATGGLNRTELRRQLDQAKSDVTAAANGVVAAQEVIAKSMVAMGEATGKGLADASAAIENWSKGYLATLHYIESQTPGATTKISAAFYAMQKALQDAASAKIDINKPGNAATALANELRTGKITVDQYAASMAKLATQLEAAAKAAQAAKKGTGEFGVQISFAEAASIAKGAGLKVTSGYRTDAEQARLFNDPRYNHPGNPVARPVSMGGPGSRHEGINGKWALDIAFAPGLTPDKLRKLYGDEGVALSMIKTESGHFHIEGSRSQAASAENAAARAARAAAAAAQKAKVDDDTFARESAQLDAEILSAKKQLVGGFDTQAQLADDEIDAQRKAQLAAVQKQLDAHQIEAAEAKILNAKVNELADTRKAGVDEQKYRQALEQTLRAVEQTLQFRSEDLKFADDMATTQSEHRKLQLAILDIQYEQRKAELDYQLMLVKRNQDFATSAALQAQAASIQGQLDRLPTEQSQDQARVRQGTLNPLEAWAKQVPHTAAQINEALQSIEVQGLDSLASSITDVITGTKSLGAAFSDIAHQIIADIIQMTIKMLIFRAISAVAGAFGGGGGGDAGAFTDIMSGGIPGFASGGMFSVGGNAGVDQNMLSINGVPRAMVGANENIAVIPQASRINMGGANGGSAPIELVIQTVPSDDAWGKVQVISAQHANQAVRVSVNHTNDTVRSLTRPRLMGGRG